MNTAGELLAAMLVAAALLATIAPWRARRRSSAFAQALDALAALASRPAAAPLDAQSVPPTGDVTVLTIGGESAGEPSAPPTPSAGSDALSIPADTQVGEKRTGDWFHAA